MPVYTVRVSITCDYVFDGAFITEDFALRGGEERLQSVLGELSFANAARIVGDVTLVRPEPDLETLRIRGHIACNMIDCHCRADVCGRAGCFESGGFCDGMIANS
jgi:hypothetical protein